MAKKRTQKTHKQPNRACKRATRSQGQNTRPKIIVPEVVEPEAASPDANAQEEVAQEVVEPEATTPDVAAQEAVAQEVVEPEAAAPDVVAPDATTSDVAAPTSTTGASGKPEAFSKKPVENASNLLNIKPFNYEKLGVFEFGMYKIPVKDVKKLEDELCLSIRRSKIDVWKETHTRRITDDIMYAVVDVLSRKIGEDLKASSEQSIVGEKYHGDVDMAIMFDSAILLVMEAKATDLNKGVAQNILQLQAAHQHNVRNGVNTNNTMFGLATTAFESVLLRAVFDDEGGMKVTRSDSITLPLSKINGQKNLPETLRKDLASLTGQIAWSVNEMASLL